jgi:hypothetical protein
MPVRPVAPLLDAVTRHRKAAAYSLFSGFVFGVGWLIWIDAAVQGPFPSTPDGWSTIAISATPIVIGSLFLIALNSTEIDDLRQLSFNYSFGLQQGRCANLLLGLSAGLGVLAIGGSLTILLFYGSWLRSPGGETTCAAAAVAATQFVFVAAIVFWVGRSHNASLL